MSTQRTAVTPHSDVSVLTWVQSGEIAILEMQRPCVWAASPLVIDRMHMKRIRKSGGAMRK